MNPPERSLAPPDGQTAGGGRGPIPGNEIRRRLSRRALLGATGAAVAVTVAGCTGEVSTGAAELPTASLRMAAVDDPALPSKVIYSIGPEHGGRRAELMDDILDGGATVDRTRPPLPEGRHVYYDDAVYQLSHEVLERTPATSYHVRVDIVQETVTESEAVMFSELPAVDRETFAARGWDDGGTFGFGTSILYTHAERDNSALVPESEYSYIVWADGSEAAWFVDDSNETTLNTYEYVAEQYAPAAEYGQRMRDRLAFELSDLPAAEAEIVHTAIDENRFAVDHEQTPSPAFQSLADRFRGQEQAHGLDGAGEGDLSGPYLVRYDGEVYWTVLNVHTGGSETDALS